MSEQPKQSESEQPASFLDRLDRLRGVERLRPADVNSVLGVRLKRDPAESTPAFDTHTGSGAPGSHIGEVELRLPIRPQGKQGGLLIVNLTGDVGVSYDDLTGRYGEPEVHPPRPGGKQTVSYWYRSESGELLKFRFSEDGSKLRLAVLDRAEIR